MLADNVKHFVADTLLVGGGMEVGSKLDTAAQHVAA